VIHHYECSRKDAACLFVKTQPVQPDGERFCEDCFADDAVKDADGGDSDLDSGKKARRLVMKLYRDGGGTVAIFGQPRQPGAARSDEGDFGHGKAAVEQNEGDQEGDFHGSIRNNSAPAGHRQRHEGRNPARDEAARRAWFAESMRRLAPKAVMGLANQSGVAVPGGFIRIARNFKYETYR
jgi:hypothetical protein